MASHELLSTGFDPDIARLTRRADEATEQVVALYLEGPDLRRAKLDAIDYVRARFAVDTLTAERYPFTLEFNGEDLVANDAHRWAEAIYEAGRDNWINVEWMLRCEAVCFMASDADEDFHRKGIALRNLADSLP